MFQNSSNFFTTSKKLLKRSSVSKVFETRQRIQSYLLLIFKGKHFYFPQIAKFHPKLVTLPAASWLRQKFGSKFFRKRLASF
jgi:hypothetical protein